MWRLSLLSVAQKFAYVVVEFVSNKEFSFTLLGVLLQIYVSLQNNDYVIW